MLARQMTHDMLPKAQESPMWVSYETWLAAEASSPVRHEYHDGVPVAMAGGTPEHGQLAANMTYAISQALRIAQRPCIVYTSDVRIRIESVNRTYYPDASVVCGTPTRSALDPHAITNPLLVLEVLSESTAAFDMGSKFSHYRLLPSLREYVLVHQNLPLVHVYFRHENGTWDILTAAGLEDEFPLQSLGLSLRMADVYYLVSGLGSLEE
ncbi:MAG: Uma2 family endonuclease [Bacteroidia bacterium]|nr:Uma2 family endonuclease [Bacteroidia bacterium]